MPSLETVFEQRLHTPQNEILLGNLAAIATAHAERAPLLSAADVSHAAEMQRISGIPSPGKIYVERMATELVARHHLTPGLLKIFAAGGTVADIGAGRSPFLGMFQDRSETVAVDADAANAAFQSRFGHAAHVAYAHDVGAIATGSIRLLHASYSAPYWSKSAEEATRTAEEYVRTLQTGGIGLVGPFSHHVEREHFESMVEGLRDDASHAITDELPVVSSMSRIRTAFCHRLLELRHLGAVELVGTRFIPRHTYDSRMSNPRVHVPNYVMIRRVA